MGLLVKTQGPKCSPLGLQQAKVLLFGPSPGIWLASMSFNGSHEEYLSSLNSLPRRPGLTLGVFLQQRESPVQRDIWPEATVSGKLI